MYLPDRMLSLARLMPNFWFLKAMLFIEGGRLPEGGEMLPVISSNVAVPAIVAAIATVAVIAAAILLLLAGAAYAYQRKEGRVYENA